MAKIQTRSFNYGNEKESEWPPMFGTGEHGHFWRDKETGKMTREPPKREEKFGEAPYVITDTMDEYYHPKAQVYVDSKSKLREIDSVCGTITTDKMQPAETSWRREQKRKRIEDHHKAVHTAVAQIDAGTAPMTEETKHLCEVQNEIVSKALNFDAFNVAGKKDNAKGKKYRRK